MKNLSVEKWRVEEAANNESGMFKLSFPRETNLKRRKLQSDIKIHRFLQLHNFKRPRNENQLLVDPWVENNLVYRIQYN